MKKNFHPLMMKMYFHSKKLFGCKSLCSVHTEAQSSDLHRGKNSHYLWNPGFLNSISRMISVY